MLSREREDKNTKSEKLKNKLELWKEMKEAAETSENQTRLGNNVCGISAETN